MVQHAGKDELLAALAKAAGELKDPAAVRLLADLARRFRKAELHNAQIRG
jgi:hypothetical protein